MDDSFAWNRIPIKDYAKKPSPRDGYSVWEYDKKMWIFGGFGCLNLGYLDDYGDFTGTGSILYRYNNQLLCYDPCSHTWTNVECFGDIPAPRADASAALMEDKVYLFGGDISPNMPNRYGLYELNMHSITWTQIEIPGLRPTNNQKTSVIPVTDNKLILYANIEKKDGFIEIVDVQSHTWKEHLEKKVGYNYDHTGITGLFGSAIILGEAIQPESQAYNHLITVRIEPKSLQQLAMQTICQKVDTSFWEILPNKLIHKMLGTE